MVGLKGEGSRLNRTVDLPAVKAAVVRWSGGLGVGKWFGRHTDFAATVVIVLALVFQVAATWDRALNPDEALVFGFVNLSGPGAVYERGRTGSAHPPLFYLILHFWRSLGQSELFLRILPMTFGAGFLWLAWRWAGRVFGKIAGFLTLLVIALSPAWLPLSSEVRHYSLMLLFSVAALVEFERGVDERSERKILLSSLFLSLAILTHYSAIFVTASLAAYEFLRLRERRAPRRLLAAWSGCQAGLAAVYLFLYFTQVKALRGSAMETRAVTGWLVPGYFQRGRENPFSFVARRTWDLFSYFFGSAPLAAVAILLAVTGVVILARKRRPAALLFVIPYLLGAAAGLLGVYPFSGTRHCAYLLLFVAAPIGVAVSALVEARRRAALLALGILAVLGWTAPAWSTPPHSRSRMNEAVDDLRGQAAPRSLIFADHRTGTVLAYYLGRAALNTERVGLGQFWESDAGGYCLIDSPRWDPAAEGFGDELERMILVYRLPAGQRLRVARLGSEFDAPAVLSRRLPDAVFPSARKFGDLSIVEVWLVEASGERSRQREASAFAGAGQ